MQRDILPIIEGSTVFTKAGPVRTDFILFIAAGAFHVSKPADLIPELQGGRFPIRVNLASLTAEEFGRILTEPQNSLTLQYTALLATEDVELEFTQAGILAIAKIAENVNRATENIGGARRLHTVLERLLEEVSFSGRAAGGPKSSSMGGTMCRKSSAKSPKIRISAVISFDFEPFRQLSALNNSKLQ